MSGNSGILIASSVAMVLVCIASCANSSTPNRFTDDPILKTVIRGKKVEIPRFRPKEVKLSDERYILDQEIVESLKKGMAKLVPKVILKGKRSLFLISSSQKVFADLDLFITVNDMLMRQDETYNLNSGLGEINGQLLDRMIKKVKGENLDQVTKEEALERFEVVMEAIERLTSMSNTGLNLDWSQMKVDGKSLEQYLKPTIQILVKRTTLYDILSETATYIKNTKWAGTKKPKQKSYDVGDFEDEYDMA